MSNEYQHNHYVPEWYQKRFIDTASCDRVLYYLDLKPESFIDSRGISHFKRALKKTGVKQCFAEDDIYTATFGEEESTKIEQLFFGEIDSNGRKAVEYFNNFQHPSADGEAFNNLLLYMSTQKLRTLKGLKWLANQVNSTDQNKILSFMVNIRQIYCAIWTECIWQIADASQSESKFIISDHPVTVYNRKCGPRSGWCRNANDPDIRCHATHTIFPLSVDKILILTNLSWVRNPYQKEIDIRPNPDFFRGAIFKFTELQVLRHLSEQEVREINFIIKSRAYRYIAAGKEEWLYPEKFVSKSDWHDYGHGYLLMPDPRGVNYTAEILIGHKDGSATGFDAYGRRPWQKEYNKEDGKHDEFQTLYCFKGEFAKLFGPDRRGRAFNMLQLDKEKDSDNFHQYHLSLAEKKYRKKRKY
jgi:hypothetical protein